MKDREQLEDWKRAANGQPSVQASTLEAVEQFVKNQAHLTFLYYCALIERGLSHDDALYLTANAKLM